MVVWVSVSVRERKGMCFHLRMDACVTIDFHVLWNMHERTWRKHCHVHMCIWVHFCVCTRMCPCLWKVLHMWTWVLDVGFHSWSVDQCANQCIIHYINGKYRGFLITITCTVGVLLHGPSKVLRHLVFLLLLCLERKEEVLCLVKHKHCPVI